MMMVTTNGGDLMTNMKADLLGWGEVWFNKQSVTKIFSYAKMAEKYQIEYDNKTRDLFLVHLEDKTVEFKCNVMNLYVYIPNKLINIQMINTLEDNKSFYTK